ncbi:tetratricopeptide repeat protein [Pseudophaeobacter leonis]|uniref:tetratricopeptide repeat protein n=1 Tax=Pseudophaeobacter leonis TaxID=1144477 RepID=UPI001F4D7E73|nr:tetratricopeptide repeat protein [Pseudophaeobacter leonis]
MATLQNRVQTDQNPPLDQQNLLLADCEAGLHTSVAAKCAALLNTFRKSHFLWGVLGNCHLQAKNLDEAATCLNKACELNPRDPASFCSLGEVYRAQGARPKTHWRCIKRPCRWTPPIWTA